MLSYQTQDIETSLKQSESQVLNSFQALTAKTRSLIFNNKHQNRENARKISGLQSKIEDLGSKIKMIEEMLDNKHKAAALYSQVNEITICKKLKAQEDPRMIAEVKREIKEKQLVVQRYEQVLGLKIKRCDNSIRFYFAFITNLNLNEHFIELQFNDQEYRVLDCSPLINNLDYLIEFLNKSQDLTVFLKEVRKEFKMLYN